MDVVKNRIVELWYKVVATFFIKYERMVWRFKYLLVPFLFWLAKILVAGVFLGAVSVLTAKGLGQPFGTEYKELLSVGLGTTGTVIAIFFSLVLIPLNQISGRYSPRFFKHLKNDHVFFSAFLYSFASISYLAYFLYKGANDYIAMSAVLQVIFLFLVLYFLWLRSIFLSNPMNGVLIPEQTEINKTVRKQIKITTKRHIRTMMAISPNTRAESGRVGYFKIDDSVTEYLKSSLLPFREVAMKALKNGELEQARNAIGSITAVTLNYLKQRKKYSDENDPIMYFIYTEFKLLAQSSSSYELKIKLHPFIVDCWKRIGIAASRVNIKGLKRMNNNTNTLAYYPVQALEELFLQNLKEDDSTTPGDASRALGDIGVTLMSEGYEHQAQQIIKKLTTLSNVADTMKVNIFSASANYALMRVYSAGLINRNKSEWDAYDYVYGKINEDVKDLLKDLVSKKRNVAADQGVLNSFIGLLGDPISGLNFSRAAEYALFSPELTERSLDKNMTEVQNISKHIKHSIDALEATDDHYYVKQAYENLYQVYLVLMSYLNNNMAASHIFFYKDEPIKNDKMQQKTENIAIDIVEYLLKKVSTIEQKRGVRGCDALGILTSIYFIAFYESVNSKGDITAGLFNRIHKLYVDALNTHTNSGTANSNSEFCKHARLIKDVLWNKKYYKKAKELNVPKYNFSSRGDAVLFESEYPQDFISSGWNVARPTVQRDRYYYGRVEEFVGTRLAG